MRVLTTIPAVGGTFVRPDQALLIHTDFDILIGIADPNYIRALRLRSPIPYIAFARAPSPQDCARCLDAGADDYVSVAIDPRETNARLNALFRRSRGLASNIIEVGDLTIDIGAKFVFLQDRRIHTSAKQFELLEALATRVGHVVTREALLDRLYGGRDEPHIKIVDVFVCKLRRKLAPWPGIETVWGIGYRMEPKLCEPLSSAPPAPAELIASHSPASLIPTF